MIDATPSRNALGERIVVLGASGFIGGAAFAALERRADVESVGVQRTPTPKSNIVHGDVTRPSSFAKAFGRAHSVIHAASYIGYDDAECERVNVQGTANVIAACADAGVDRLIYLSTAAVYGAGVHRNARESELVVAPNSVLSASRASAEEMVLEAGGVVVRPHFICGPGDTWLVPGILKLVTGIKGIPEGGRARHSAISVGDLGQTLADLALAPSTIGPAAFHVAADEPVSIEQLVRSALPHEEFIELEDLSRGEARRRAQKAGLSARHIEWLADDHVYDTSAIREVLGATPTASFHLTPKEHAWQADGLDR